jgi:hypothetical protein
MPVSMVHVSLLADLIVACSGCSTNVLTQVELGPYSLVSEIM